MATDGRTFSGADYLDALEQVAALRLQFSDIFSRYDLVLTPNAATLPWPAEHPYPASIDGRPAGPRDHAIFTGWVTVARLPAISPPVALSEGGWPVGAQLVAGLGRDEELLAFAEAMDLSAPRLPQA